MAGQTLVSTGMKVVAMAKDGDVQPREDKPTKSKKNDDKDEDPGDGNAGPGDDNLTLPKEAPAAN
ncbi:MAG: hypothetical protein ABIP55_07600 [Tepidisphaeraceae bacterium]